MSRPSPLALLMLSFALFAAGSASATTYYIAANGSDSNNGTSKTSPWQHAPGMTNCSGNCSSVNARAGDQFILRGGDTWFLSGDGSPVGLPWTITETGSSGNPIIFGTDQSWYNSATCAAAGYPGFCRPIMSGGNPTAANSTHKDSNHPGFVTACTHNDTGNVLVNITNSSWVTFDNIEFAGWCTGSVPGWGDGYLDRGASTNVVVSHSYFHSMTMLYQTSFDGATAISGSNDKTNNGDVIAYNVFDNSDAGCSGPNNCSGWGVYANAPDVHHNVFRYFANGVNGALNQIYNHDNLYEHMYESMDVNSHGGLAEWQGDVSGNTAIYIYNNVLSNNAIGIDLSPSFPANGYVFNNVVYGDGNPANCFQALTFTSGAKTAWFFNNTIDSQCNWPRFLGQSGQNWNGTGHFENNHYIGYSQLSNTYQIDGGTSTTISNDGGLLFQSESTANGQGYTPSNNYAPTSAGDSTVGAGNNKTAFCNGMADATASAACKAANSAVSYDAINHVVVLTTVVPRPSSGAWDIGAYQFGSAVTVNPPSGLTAVVQ